MYSENRYKLEDRNREGEIPNEWKEDFYGSRRRR